MDPNSSLRHEHALTAALLFDPSTVESISSIVAVSDLAWPLGRWVYQTILDRRDAGDETDGPIIIDLARTRNTTTDCVDILSGLLSECPTASNIRYYARKVKEKSIKRRLQEHAANDHAPDLGTLRGLEAELEEITAPPVPHSQTSAGSVAQHVLDHPLRGGIDPGWDCLRNAVRRVWPTHLWVVGGYTSVGKTAFAIATILEICERTPGARALVCSTEMARHTYAARMLANLSGISALAIMLGELGPAVENGVSQAQGTLDSYQITIRDDAYTLRDIESAIKQACPDIVVLDFAQNVRVPSARNVYERMVEVSMFCQEIPKRHNLTMIALSQTDNASIRDKAPELIATKGGGELAAAADLVIWLERIKETPYLKVSIRKNRHGPTGGRYFEYVRNYTGFSEKGVEFRMA